jgi:hypothetical protein
MVVKAQTLFDVMRLFKKSRQQKVNCQTNFSFNRHYIR